MIDLEKVRDLATKPIHCPETDEVFRKAIAEIEQLRADNAGLSKAVIDIGQERDLAQAEFRAYHKAWEDQAAEIERVRAENVSLLVGIRLGSEQILENQHDIIRTQTARIQELEDALAEYQRLGKTIAGKVPCLALHGDCGRCSAKMREVCGALEQIAGGKIGPDVKPRSWQITDERKAALTHLLAVNCPHGHCTAAEALRDMLAEATR